VSYGTIAEDEDFIVGSPSGLRALRDHIDQAIQNGETRINDARIQFNGIKCKEEMLADASSSSWKSSLMGYGLVAVVFVILALAIYGAISLFR
jgi:hypothetical protein